MNDQELDLSNLAQKLLAQHRRIELVPGELTDDRRIMRLVPMRNGKKLNCNFVYPESLPALDLARAGIDTGRYQSTLTLEHEVAKLLKGRQFIVRPNFNPTAGFNNFAGVCQALHLNDLAMSLGGMLAVTRGHLRSSFVGAQIDQKLVEPDLERGHHAVIERFMKVGIGFHIRIVGKQIKGLNLSRPVVGLLTDIVGFLFAVGNRQESKEFWAAIDYCQIREEITNSEKLHGEYYAANSGKWWFPLFGKEKKWRMYLAERREALRNAMLVANGASIAQA
ncbi:MAG: hypothetical protein WCT45_03060 [Candidatus Paceibacterota bacterium]